MLKLKCIYIIIEVFRLVYFFVGIGGIAGSLLRYLLSILAVDIWGKEFPLGTLLINLLGAFILGWLTSRLVVPKKLPPYLLTALSTGVIGSFTTFSTFCIETVNLIESAHYIKGFLYMILSLFGGLSFVRLGINLGEQQLKKRGTQV
jgi:CrcB protein